MTQQALLYSIYLYLAIEVHITSSIISWSVQNIFECTEFRIYFIALSSEYISLHSVQNIFHCTIALSSEYISLH